MRFTLALLASLMAGTAFADSIAVPPAQHGIFDGGQLPPGGSGPHDIWSIWWGKP